MPEPDDDEADSSGVMPFVTKSTGSELDELYDPKATTLDCARRR